MQTVSPAKVIEVKEYTGDLREYILAPAKYRRYNPGTFLQLTLESVTASDRWPESRTFSMASAYNKQNKTMKLLIRKAGKYTSRIFDELELGKSCTIKYSFGDMVIPQFDTQSDIVCIAGGTGVAPFLSFIEGLEKEGDLNRLKLLYSVRRKEDFISLDYITKTLIPENLKLFCTDVKSDKGMFRMMNLEDIMSMTSQGPQAHYYICGAPEFITFFRDELQKKGITNIHLDEWE